MDKDQLEVLNRQDKYSARMFYICCMLSVLLFASIINNNMVVNKAVTTMEDTVVEITQSHNSETKEIVRLYFETDYLYPEQTIEQHNEMKVND